MNKFKSSTDMGSGWPIASTGCDMETGQTTYHVVCVVPGSEYHCYTGGAQADAELIARLLNEYYGETLS